MELPRLEPLWKKYRDRGFSIVAVEATGDRERAVQFIEKNGLTYHLLEAEELLEEGKMEDAARLLERAVRHDPDLLPARCRLGELLVGLRRPADAVPHLEACLDGLGEEADPAERQRVEALIRQARGGRKGSAPAGRLQP